MAPEREMQLRAEKEDLAYRLEVALGENKELRNRVNELECVLAKHEEERKCLSEAWKEGLRHNEILEAKLSMVNLIFGNRT